MAFVTAEWWTLSINPTPRTSTSRLLSAKSYAKANPLLIQVRVPGRTAKKFWRLSDKATRITRKLALILRSHHAVGKHLAAPLQVSNVWIGSAGGGSAVVKLRGVSFTAKGFGVDRVRDDYTGTSPGSYRRSSESPPVGTSPSHEYRRTQSDLLRLNRNVRSHLHEYDDGIEETLYCEWPELLVAMVKMLHLEGELEATDIENKFG